MAPGARHRLTVLKEILLEGMLSTQDDLREELGRRKFEVNQSTISRDLKRLGAIKALDPEGTTIYRLSESGAFNPPLPAATSLRDLVSGIRSNGMLIVINTAPGSASLVARHLDSNRPGGILGTIAGDDTIFVAPASVKDLPKTLSAIEESLS